MLMLLLLLLWTARAINCTQPWQFFTLPAWYMECEKCDGIIHGTFAPTTINAQMISQDPNGSHFLMSVGYSYGEANWCDQSTYAPQYSIDCGTLSMGQSCNLQAMIQNSALPSYYYPIVTVSCDNWNAPCNFLLTVYWQQ